MPDISIAITEAQIRLHHDIEESAEAAQDQIKHEANRARDLLSVKIGWMIRSNAQLRRFRNAKR